MCALLRCVKTASQCVKAASQCIKAASQWVKALVRPLTKESSVLITQIGGLVKRQKQHITFTNLPSYHGSAWCSSTLQLYISPNIFPCYYLPVQLMYLNELCREYDETDHACVNSGHQVLLSDFTEHLGMRLMYSIYSVHECISSMCGL